MADNFGFFGDAGGPVMGVGIPSAVAPDWWVKNEPFLGQPVKIANLPAFKPEPPPLTEDRVREILREELTRMLPDAIAAALKKTLPRQFFE